MGIRRRILLVGMSLALRVRGRRSLCLGESSAGSASVTESLIDWDFSPATHTRNKLTGRVLGSASAAEFSIDWQSRGTLDAMPGNVALSLIRRQYSRVQILQGSSRFPSRFTPRRRDCNGVWTSFRPLYTPAGTIAADSICVVSVLAG